MAGDARGGGAMPRARRGSYFGVTAAARAGEPVVMEARARKELGLPRMTGRAVGIGGHRLEGGGVIMAGRAVTREMPVAGSVGTIETRLTMADFAEAAAGVGQIDE